MQGIELTASGREPVLTVELELHIVNDSVLVISQTLTVGSRGGTSSSTLEAGSNSEGTVVVTTGVLDGPCQIAGGVVEVQPDVGSSAGGSRGNGFSTGVLELSDEVLVLVLSESATLIGIEEDIGGIEGGGRCVGGVNASCGHGGSRSEVEVELQFVVLHRGKKEREVSWFGFKD